MNTVRRFIDEHNYDKVIVFWDGENNSIQRKRIFAEYKENRRYNRLNDIQKQSYDWQMGRVKQYLEEMFIRQVEVNDNESDDMIAYYCQISVDENKTIFSADKDLTQLISESVQVYSPSQKEMIKFGDKVKLKDISIPHQNVSTFKIISGDKSDNIGSVWSVTKNGRKRGIGSKGAQTIYNEYLTEFGEMSFNDPDMNENIADLICEKKKLSKTKIDEIVENIESNFRLIDLRLSSLPLEVVNKMKITYNEKY